MSSKECAAAGNAGTIAGLYGGVGFLAFDAVWWS